MKKKSPEDKRSKMVSFKLTQKEFEMLKDGAKKLNVSISDFLRAAIYTAFSLDWKKF